MKKSIPQETHRRFLRPRNTVWLFAMLLLSLSFEAAAQCPPGDVRLKTQAEVNQFVTDYPNCTEIAGLLRIGADAAGSGSDITDISGLHNLERIDGALFVQHNGVLQNLDGLGNLRTVARNVSITGNAELRNINPLGGLTDIGTNLVIFQNALIRNLDAFSGVSAINGFISIDGNAALDDISGIRHIDPNTVTELYIQNNPALSVCDLDNVCSYLQSAKPRNISGNAGNCLDEPAVIADCARPNCPPGDIFLFSQAEVNAFAASYPNCTVIAGALQIGPYVESSPGDIADLSPLSSITQINGSLYIQNNAVLQNLNGLSITDVGGNLYIGGDFNDRTNLQLQNIEGLSSLTSVGGWLTIKKNSSLTNLYGLQNLATVAFDIYIVDNNVLTDISVLRNTTFSPNAGYGLTILNNLALSVCNLPNFCTYLANPPATHPRDISGNAGDCITEQAVVDACNTPACPPGDVRLKTQAEVNQFVADYPHCTEIAGLLRIGADDGLTSDITDISGLRNLNKIGAILFVQNNGVLQNLDGLAGLTQLGGRLYIGVNAQLQHIDGLANISSIEGAIAIRGNAVLSNIQGVRNIDPIKITELFIDNNPGLSVCNLPNLCTYLANPAGTHPRTIAGNAGDCITDQAVIDACNAPAEGCTNVTSIYEQWPQGTFNPQCQGTEETITIEGETGEYSKVQVSAGRIYTFSSSVATDYVTIANEDASVVYAYGSSPVTWTATGDEVVRFFLHLDDQCNSSTAFRSRIVSCRVQPGDDCADAYDINGLFGGPQNVSQTSGLYDNTGYTSINDPATGHECHTGDPGLRYTVWYTFTGDGNTYRIRSVRCSATNYNEDTQTAIYSGVCGALVPEACNDDEDAANGIYNFSVELSTVQGRSYRMLVDGYGASQGEYCLEVTRLSSTGVTEITSTDIRVSPNPSTGMIRLDNVTADEVQVYDARGRQVLQVVRPGSEIDLTRVPAGMYVLKIISGGQQYSARVVKQ